MERVSLTYFVDFVLKVGTPKLAGVKEFKEHRYDHLTDFYKPLRESIIDMHEKGKPDRVLDEFLGTLTDERKRRIFPGLVESYRKFQRSSRSMKWFTPPHTTLTVDEPRDQHQPGAGLRDRRDAVPHQDLLPRRAALAEARLGRPRAHQLGARRRPPGHRLRHARREERAPAHPQVGAEPAPRPAHPRRGRRLLHHLRRRLSPLPGAPSSAAGPPPRLSAGCAPGPPEDRAGARPGARRRREPVALEQVARALLARGQVVEDVEAAFAELAREPIELAEVARGGGGAHLALFVAKLEHLGIQTTAGRLIGSALYAAPEQLRNGPVHPSWDVFAMGIILYEALSGAHPVDASSGNPMDICCRHLDFRPRPLAEVAPHVPGDLAYLVGEALDTDASRRPTMRALAERLHDTLQRVSARQLAEVRNLLPDRRTEAARTVPLPVMSAGKPPGALAATILLPAFGELPRVRRPPCPATPTLLRPRRARARRPPTRSPRRRAASRAARRPRRRRAPVGGRRARRLRPAGHGRCARGRGNQGARRRRRYRGAARGLGRRGVGVVRARARGRGAARHGRGWGGAGSSAEGVGVGAGRAVRVGVGAAGERGGACAARKRAREGASAMRAAAPLRAGLGAWR